MSESTDERLRRALAAGADRPPSDCPDPEHIWAVSRGEVAEEEAARTLDHSLECAACAEALQLARAVAAGIDSALRPAREARRARRPQGLRWLAAAAVLAVVATVVWQVQLRRIDSTSDFRAPGGVALESSIPAGAVLPREAFVLRWRSGSPTAAESIYSVRVATQDLRVLHRARGIEEQEYTVPAEVFEDLPSGTAILWTVEAVGPDAARLTSDTFRVALE